MKIPCPNPPCGRHISGPKTLIGRHIACPACGHSFIGSDCFHSSDSFVIYDLETTGFYPESDEFIQIAAVRYQSGSVRPDDGFFSYARPRQRISSFITSYTGIRNADVCHAPVPEEVLCQFARWAGDSTLVAHNGLRFDSKFLAISSSIPAP